MSPRPRHLLFSLAACAGVGAAWLQERAEPALVELPDPPPTWPERTPAARTGQAMAAPGGQREPAEAQAWLLELDDDPGRWDADQRARLRAAAGQGQAYARSLLRHACDDPGLCAEFRRDMQAAVARGDADAAFQLWQLAEDEGDEQVMAEALPWLVRFGELGDPDQRLEAAGLLLSAAVAGERERALATDWVVGLAAVGEPRALAEVLAAHEGWDDQLAIATDPSAHERTYRALLASGDAEVLEMVARRYAWETDNDGDVLRVAEVWEAAGGAGSGVGDNNAAWLLSLCDGGPAAMARAAQLIARQHAVHGTAPWSLDTEAFIHAAQGDFGAAIALQERALAELQAAGVNRRRTWEYQRRLDLYRRSEIYAPRYECGERAVRKVRLAEVDPVLDGARVSAVAVQDARQTGRAGMQLGMRH